MSEPVKPPSPAPLLCQHLRPLARRDHADPARRGGGHRAGRAAQLALAFSLAGIIAGVQFRRALQDTFDALFILVAIGTGISAGVKALEIAAVLTVFFCYATLYVYYQGDGLESDFEAERRRLKAARKAAEAQVDD